MEAPTTSTYKVHAPLSNFSWAGASFNLFPQVLLDTIHPNLKGRDADLGKDEQRELQSATHWLHFDWERDSEPSPAETVTLFLLSLWLARPTRSHVRCRFELKMYHTSNQHITFWRMLDRFNWIPGYVRDSHSTRDLTRAARYFNILRSISLRRGRLRQSLGLNAAGCMAYQWHVAFICHSAAAEALLTYSTDPGITKRLATSFACLTRRSKVQRDAAYRRFYGLYDVRSDIMHGRLEKLRTRNKLLLLARLEDASRSIWRQVFRSSSLRNILEADDSRRKQHFAQLEAGYRQPI